MQWHSGFGILPSATGGRNTKINNFIIAIFGLLLFLPEVSFSQSIDEIIKRRMNYRIRSPLTLNTRR